MTTETDEAGFPPASRGPMPPVNLFRSPAAKFFVTGAITLMLMIPLWMVFALTADRESRRNEVVGAIGREWGPQQSLYGPLLVIPYLARTPGGPSEAPLARRHLVVLPDTLDAVITAATERRNVSIYEVPVYSSRIVAKGSFAPIDPALFGGDMTSVLWDEAYLSVAVAALTGIEDATLAAAGRTLAIEPGAARDGAMPMLNGGTVSIGSGLHAAFDQSGPIGGFDFALELRVRGTDSLTIAPVGRQSVVTIDSNWPHPNFAVGMLPSERTVSGEDFKATWRVPYLARPAPQSWTIERDGYYRFGSEYVGVGFVEPVDFYALVERSLKYGVMFIGVTFLAVFMLETLSPRRIHVVQYCLVGLILVMFFVLLLAFSERIGFGPAYLVAAAATTLVVSAFVGLALESRARAGAAAAVFAITFGLLYAILRLEDLALLVGSVIGFVALSGLLFATRKVDWSGLGQRVSEPPPPRPIPG